MAPLDEAVERHLGAVEPLFGDEVPFGARGVSLIGAEVRHLQLEENLLGAEENWLVLEALEPLEPLEELFLHGA